MRVEISMNRAAAIDSSSSANLVRGVILEEPSTSAVELHTEYLSLTPKSTICVAKYWVIKRGLTAMSGLGIGVWITVAFGGIITLLVNPGYNACINTAAGMLAVGVLFSALSAILYTKVIGYCREQELSVSKLARKLALGEGGGPAFVALGHLEQPLEVMAPIDVIERARIREKVYKRKPPILQYSRGMTLKYGCVGLDGKSVIVYLPDPNAPIDKYPNLKGSVITAVALFYVGICIITVFMITWVSAYPYDHQTLKVCVAMEVVGGFVSLIGVSVCIYIYMLCEKYEIQDSADYEKNTFTNPIMTIS